MKSRVKLLVVCSLIFCILAVTAVKADPFSCYGACTGCTCHVEGGEITECCGWCNWSGPGGRVYCCYPDDGCRRVPPQ